MVLFAFLSVQLWKMLSILLSIQESMPIPVGKGPKYSALLGKKLKIRKKCRFGINFISFLGFLLVLTSGTCVAVAFSIIYP